MYIASVSTTIKFHQFPTGNVVHNYQPGKVEGPIRSISWSRDGNWLAVVPHSGQTEIVSIKDQLKLLKTIHEVDEPTAVCFQNTTKKNIGIGTKSGLVLIYDIKSKNVKKRFTRVTTSITHMAFTVKDTHCVAACKNGDVFVYNNVTNSPPANLRVPKSNSVNCLKTNQIKRNLVLGGSNEGIIVVWDININRSKFYTEAHKAPVNSAAFSPVNSDLIVTSGADRQFCFFDIADGKCIANVSVENNITAVDFSPDGTYVVMASQNGRVYVYDSRNILEPVHSFLAHKSAIRHIAFQNIQDTTNESVCSSSVSKCSENTTSLKDDVVNKTRKSVRTSDFFGIHVQLGTTLDTKSITSVDEGDSFIAALGLDKNSIAVSVNNDGEISDRNDDSVFSRETSSKLPSIHHSEASPSPLYFSKLEADYKLKQFSSTPKFQEHTNPDESTNLVQKSSVNGTVANDIKHLVKESLNEEFKNVLDDLKNDIKYQSTHTIYQLRNILLGMQMKMVKLGMKLENIENKIRNDVVTSNCENCEENEKLQKKIEFLEEQLRKTSGKTELNDP